MTTDFPYGDRKGVSLPEQRLLTKVSQLEYEISNLKGEIRRLTIELNGCVDSLASG